MRRVIFPCRLFCTHHEHRPVSRKGRLSLHLQKLTLCHEHHAQSTHSCLKCRAAAGSWAVGIHSCIWVTYAMQKVPAPLRPELNHSDLQACDIARVMQEAEASVDSGSFLWWCLIVECGWVDRGHLGSLQTMPALRLQDIGLGVSLLQHSRECPSILPELQSEADSPRGGGSASHTFHTAEESWKTCPPGPSSGPQAHCTQHEPTERSQDQAGASILWHIEEAGSSTTA